MYMYIVCIRIPWKLGTVRQHDRLLRRTTQFSLPGSKAPPSPRVPTAFQGSKCVRKGLKRRKCQVRARYQVRANRC